MQKILSVYLASECDSRLGYSDYSFLAVFLLKNALIFEWHAAFFDSRCLLAQGPCLPMLPVVFTREFFLLHWPCVVYFFSHFLYTKRLIGILAADLFLWVISSGFSLKSSIPWSISILNKLYLIFKLRSLMSLIVSWFLGLMSSKNTWNGPLLFLPQGSFHLFGMEGIVVVICKYLLLVVHTDECSQ